MNLEKLPLGWAWATLSEFLQDRGSTVDPLSWPDTEFVLYSVPSYASGKPEISFGKDVGSTKQALAPGTVLLCKINPRINRVWVTADHGSEAKLIGSTEWITFPSNPAFDPEYLKLFLKQESVRRFLTENTSGVGGSLTRVNANVVGTIDIPVAPFAEQERIAEAVNKIFVELDDAEADLARARAGVEQFRASLLHGACTGQLTAAWRQANPPTETGADLLRRILAERRAAWERTERARLEARGTPPRGDAWKARYEEPVSPDVSDVPDLPDGWVWASLDQLVSTMTSGSRAWMPYYGKGDCIFVMAQNVKPDRLDLTFKQLVDPPIGDAERERTRIHKDDILLTIVGAKTGDACHVNMALHEHYVCQSVALMRPVLAETAAYITKYLSSPHDGRHVLDRMAYGAGRPHLNFEQLKAMPVPVPPLSELKEVTEIFIASYKEAFEESSFDLKLFDSSLLRQAILHAAFNGRLVPQSPDDEPADVLLARLRGTPVSARRKSRRAPAELSA